jgi:formate hydrogenlyase subunit 3/multisubunit Na+/H+ antiporter MnhD subunit
VSLLPFLLVAIGASALSLILRQRREVAITIGVLGLAVALVLATTIRPGERLELGGAILATTEYLRLFLVLGCVAGLCLAVIGLAAGSRRDAPAVMLGTLGAAALALAMPDARIAVIASTAGGLLGVLVTLVPSGARVGATVGIREIRAVIIAGTLAVAAAAWIERPLGDLSIQPVVFGLAYLAFALAVAVRFGVIPFHFWAARLADAAPEVTLPVLTAWGPAVLAVVALAWIDGSVSPILPEIGGERAVLVAIALMTIVLAAFAAWIQDDLEHVLGYSIMGDAGVVLLGLATLGPEAWTPARTWILAFVVARSAFAAWAAAIRATFWTGRVDDLRGWVFRSPPLALALVLIIVASVGLPGLAAWEARGALVGLLFSAPWSGLVLLATLGPLAYYGRLLAVGLRRPHGGSSAEDWRPAWPAVDLTQVRSSLATVARVNRGATTAIAAVLLAAVALGTSGGAFGVTRAAAGVGPGFEGGAPVEPVGPGEDPSPAASEPPASPEPSPSLERSPSPTAVASPSTEVPSAAP